MKQSIFPQLNSDRAEAVNQRVSRTKEDKNGKSNFLGTFKKGQYLSGKVVSVGDTVTVSFAGREVSAPWDVLKDARVGDVKLFEVTRMTAQGMELKVVPDTSAKDQRTAGRAFGVDLDQDILLDRKEAAKQARQVKENKSIQSKMNRILVRLTQQDYGTILEEGFSAQDLTVDGLSAAIDRKKAQDPQGRDEKKQKSSYTDEDIKERLKDENLPAADENIRQVQTALGLSDITPRINDKTMKYMISNNLDPAIENIYKAYYNGNALKTEGMTTLSDTEWTELKGQAAEIIASAGYDVNEDNLDDARWLVENGLPLTADSFGSLKDLKTIQSGSDKEDALDKIVEGLKEGILPGNASLRPDKDYKALVQDIRGISDEAVSRAVKEGSDITLRGLLKLQAGLSDGPETVAEKAAASIGDPTENEPAQAEKARKEEPSEDARDIKEAAELGQEDKNNSSAAIQDNYKDAAYEEVRARRQLEEIRLKMTTEAAARLDKMGIHPDTEQLEKVVESLRALEDNYYKGLLQEADLQESAENIQLLKDTTVSVEQLRYLPGAVLGSTLSEQDSQTIPGLLGEGAVLSAQYAKAGEAYETLMTVPNAEYGDSIRKAFQNAGSLMEELGIENTLDNQRAVRILGYNQMEINEESVGQVKAYDAEVTGLIRNLHPAVTVRLIKEGINPLNMPITELNTEIDRIKEEQGITSEDKFSSYLQKLEKTDSITGEERKAYIGIYRLLYNVEKSDGAALGAVIKSGREITLNSLLTAVRTEKKGSIDSVINDEFGTLEGLEKNAESITEQTGAVFAREEETGGKNGRTGKNLRERQAEYLGRILKDMKDDISPDKLESLHQALGSQSGQSAGSTVGYVPELSSKEGIWETLKDVPVEKLNDSLKNIDKPETAADYGEQVREIRELYKNSDAAVRFLSDYKMPGTAVNLMMANHILSNGETPIKKLMKLQKENMVEKPEDDVKETDDLTDKLIDRDSINAEYEKLEATAKDALKRACSGEIIDSGKLAELKSLGTQMTFLKTLAGKEFYRIPIETEGVITNMNLTILHDTKDAGKLSVTVSSGQLGDIKAEFSLKDKMLKGYIGCDSREGLERLRNNSQEIETAAGENNVSLRQLDFGLFTGAAAGYAGTGAESKTGTEGPASDTERTLYRLAKAMVNTVRLTERSALKEKEAQNSIS